MRRGKPGPEGPGEVLVWVLLVVGLLAVLGLGLINVWL
jgi:hypothetical protein